MRAGRGLRRWEILRLMSVFFVLCLDSSLILFKCEGPNISPLVIHPSRRAAHPILYMGRGRPRRRPAPLWTEKALEGGRARAGVLYRSGICKVESLGDEHFAAE
jgi:hypothetical protein